MPTARTHPNAASIVTPQNALRLAQRMLRSRRKARTQTAAPVPTSDNAPVAHHETESNERPTSCKLCGVALTWRDAQYGTTTAGAFVCKRCHQGAQRDKAKGHYVKIAPGANRQRRREIERTDRLTKQHARRWGKPGTKAA